MLNIPSRYRHFIYGVLQSGLTCAIAAAIACLPYLEKGLFVRHWLRSWSFSWLTMLPVVVVAAPILRRLSEWVAK
jgi:hypothetical protein